MLSLVLIYFLTRLLPDLPVYFFQNRPVLFPGQRSHEATKPGLSYFGYFYVVVYVVTDACLLLLCLF